MLKQKTPDLPRYPNASRRLTLGWLKPCGNALTASLQCCKDVDESWRNEPCCNERNVVASGLPTASFPSQSRCWRRRYLRHVLTCPYIHPFPCLCLVLPYRTRWSRPLEHSAATKCLQVWVWYRDVCEVHTRSGLLGAISLGLDWNPGYLFYLFPTTTDYHV